MPSLVVQQVAGKLEVARLGKRPLQFRGLSRGDVLDLRLPLLPVLLAFRVLVVLRALLRQAPPLRPAGSMTNSWTS